MIHRNDHKSCKFSLLKTFALTGQGQAQVRFELFTVFRRALISTMEAV